MKRASPSFAVIRLIEVAISQDALTAALSVQLNRFVLQRGGIRHDAQINVPEGDNLWRAVGDMLSKLGPSIAALIIERRIGSATLDLAFLSLPEQVTRSSSIPSSIALAAGQSLVDIEVSTYPSDGPSSEPDGNSIDQH